MTETFQIGPLRVWHHPASGDKRVILMHGVNEHSGRHGNHIEFFKENNIDLVRFDFRGHGQSQGERMWIDSFRDYIEDATNVIHWAQQSLPKKKTFLLGHSLGALVATAYAGVHNGTNLQGIILDAPAFGAVIPQIFLRAISFAGRFLRKRKVHHPLIYFSVSSDKSVRDAYRKDPLVQMGNSLYQSREILKFIDSMPDSISKIRIPVLCLHGDADPLTNVKATRDLFQLCPAKDKTLHIYAGGYHELHNDVVKGDYFRDLNSWLAAH